MVSDHIMSRALPAVDSSSLAWAEDGLLAFNKGSTISIMRPSLKSITTAKSKNWFTIDTPSLDGIEGKFTWLDGLPNPYGFSIGETVHEELSVGIAWSPIGAGPEASCLLAVVTNAHRVYVFSAGPTYESVYLLKYQITTLLASYLGVDDGAIVEKEILLRKLRTMSISWSQSCILQNGDRKHILALGHQALFVTLWSVVQDEATIICELNVAEMLGEDNFSTDNWINLIKWGPWSSSDDKRQFKSFLALSTSEGRIILVPVVLTVDTDSKDGITVIFEKALECIPANPFLPSCLESYQKHLSGSCIFAVCQTCKITLILADPETKAVQKLFVECDNLMGSVSGLAFAKPSAAAKGLSVYVLSNNGAGAEILIDYENDVLSATLKDSNEAYSTESSSSSKLISDIIFKKSEQSKLKRMNIVDMLIFGMVAYPSLTDADPCLIVYAYTAYNKETLHYPQQSTSRVHFAFLSLVGMEEVDQNDKIKLLNGINEWPLPLTTFGPYFTMPYSVSIGLYQTHILLREPEWRLLRNFLHTNNLDKSQNLIDKPRRLRPIAALYHYCKRLIKTELLEAVNQEDLQSMCKEILNESVQRDDCVKAIEKLLKAHLYESKLACLLRYILALHLLLFDDYLSSSSKSGEQNPIDATSFFGEDPDSVMMTEPERATMMLEIHKEYLEMYKEFRKSLQMIRQLVVLRLSILSAAIILYVERIYERDKESTTTTISSPERVGNLEKWVYLYFSGLSCQVLSGYISMLVHLDENGATAGDEKTSDDTTMFPDTLYNRMISKISTQLENGGPKELGVNALKFLSKLRNPDTGFPIYNFKDLNEFLTIEMKKEFDNISTTCQTQNFLIDGTLQVPKLENFDRAIIHVDGKEYEWLRCCLTLLPIMDIGAKIAFNRSVSVLFPYEMNNNDDDDDNFPCFFSSLWSTCSQICIFTGLPYKRIN